MAEFAGRNARDTVFTNLFSHLNDLLDLYKAPHPEDRGITVDRARTVTPRSVLTDVPFPL